MREWGRKAVEERVASRCADAKRKKGKFTTQERREHRCSAALGWGEKTEQWCRSGLVMGEPGVRQVGYRYGQAVSADAVVGAGGNSLLAVSQVATPHQPLCPWTPFLLLSLCSFLFSFLFWPLYTLFSFLIILPTSIASVTICMEWTPTFDPRF